MVKKMWVINMKYNLLSSINVVKTKLLSKFILLCISLIILSFILISSNSDNFNKNIFLEIIGYGDKESIISTIIRVLNIVFIVYSAYLLLVNDLLYCIDTIIIRNTQRRWLITKTLTIFIILLIFKFIIYLIISSCIYIKLGQIIIYPEFIIKDIFITLIIALSVISITSATSNLKFICNILLFFIVIMFMLILNINECSFLLLLTITILYLFYVFIKVSIKRFYEFIKIN